MECCKNCFGQDSYIANQVLFLSEKKGKCELCKSTMVDLINPRLLTKEFEFLFSIYQDGDGPEYKSIIDCLIDDWAIFEGRDKYISAQILCTILDDSTLITKKFAPQSLSDLSPKNKWDSFCLEMKKERRFFPLNKPDLESLPTLFSVLAEDLDGHIFRARIDQDKALTKSEMGMPPNNKAKAGRANPLGIPYFYAASNINTAIAEIRPHPGNNITVGKFKLNRSFTVIDLINPKEKISPFFSYQESGDEDDLLRHRYDIEFLCHLGEMLSKPIVPNIADLEYLPTQYLCEFIKVSGYDGVRYKSSVGSGYNYALFSDVDINIRTLSYYRIDNLEYELTKIT